MGVDIVGPFAGPTGRTDKYILVVIDLVTSWVEATTMQTLTAQETCDAFFKLIVSKHGCPKKVLTDMGTQFTSKLFKHFCDRFGIQLMHAAAMHQQANGKVERFIGFLVRTMFTLVADDHSDWDRVIDNCLMVYRVSTSRALGDSPFFLIYGRDPILPQDVQLGVETNGRQTRPVSLEEHRRNQYDALRLAHDKLLGHKKDEHDSSHVAVNFGLGSLVMVYFHVPKVGVSRKLIPPWEGPFRVMERVDDVIYKVRNVEDGRVLAVQVVEGRWQPQKPRQHLSSKKTTQKFGLPPSLLSWKFLKR